ncbi:MAG: hypothetical protein U0Q14_10815 [Dermatophilaceae bacterium]
MVFPPRPGRADDRDGLPRLDDEVEVLDKGGLVSSATENGDVLEAHLAAVRGTAVRDRCDGIRRLLGRVEHLEDPLRRGDPGLGGSPLGATCVNGWVAGARKCWMKAWTSPAICRATFETTDDGDEHVVEVPDEHHRRHDDAAAGAGPRRRRCRGFVVLRREGPLDLGLPAEDLDGWWPVKVSSMIPLRLTGGRPAAHEGFLAAVAIAAVTSTEIGMDTRATSASNQESRTSSRTARTVSRELSRRDRVCQRHRDVVDVIGHPAQQGSPRGWPSK